MREESLVVLQEKEEEISAISTSLTTARTREERLRSSLLYPNSSGLFSSIAQ